MQTISGLSNSYTLIATRIGPTIESVALIWTLKGLLVLHKYTIFSFLVNKFVCCKKLGTRSMSHQCSKYTPIRGLIGLDILIIHSFILDISIAPLQVHYYSEALHTTAVILCW